MKLLTRSDLVDLDTYEMIRPEYRRRVIDHKLHRRIGVGDRVTLVFEDRETIRYQILEMARIEQIREEAGIQVQLDVYNELMPGDNELSATLFIEIPELDQVRPELDRLVGIDEHVALVLGEGRTASRIEARFDPKQMEEDRISAVQYIRFALSPDQAARFADEPSVELRIDHPHYRHATALDQAARASLQRDLRDETPVLLDPASTPRAERPPEELLFESDDVRAYRPARSLHADHVIVEPVHAVPNLVAASADVLVRVMPVVQRFAREIAVRNGRCTVQTEISPEVPTLRWHLFAPR